MKDPAQQAQQPDPRFVSAYSVYNGLVPGLKSYQDTSTSEASKRKKARRRNKKESTKSEDVKKIDKKPEEPERPSTPVATTPFRILPEKRGTQRGTPVPSEKLQSARIGNGTENEKKKSKSKKRKKNKKKSSESKDDEEPPTKNLKLVPNPLAATLLKANTVDKKRSASVEGVLGLVTKKDKATEKKKTKAKNKMGSLVNGDSFGSPIGKSLSANFHLIPHSLDQNQTSKKAKNKKTKKSKIEPGPPSPCTSRTSRLFDYSKCTIESKVPPTDLKGILNTKRIEDSVAHGKAIFEWLIHPLSSEEFMKNYWEKKPLLIKRKHQDSENYYKWILTTQKFDDILRRNVIKYGVNLDITSFTDGVRETLSENMQGRVRPAVVLDYYNNGCSIRMLNPQTYIQQLWRVNSSLQEFLGSFVGANLYLTPPDSQGFAPHYDDIEAFILQVEGKKHWKLYESRKEDERLPRFSSGNFSEADDGLGEPIMDLILEEGDLLYFPRGMIHQANTVDGEHSLHLTLSCNQLNTYGDLLKHHINHALDKLIASDIKFRQGLPVDYLSFMGIVHANTRDPKLKKKRTEFSRTIDALVSKLSKEPADFAADAMGKKFVWDSLPPFLSSKERETSVAEDGEFMQNGRVFNRVEFGPEVEVKLVRKNCARLVVEEGMLRLYFTSENSLTYHEEEAQYLELSVELAPSVNYLISQYPNYTKIEDLPLGSGDLGQKIQLVSDLWERGLIFTKEPLEPCQFDDVGSEESESLSNGENENDNDEDVESIVLSDLPQEDDDEGSDDFYDTTISADIDERSEDEGEISDAVDDGQADHDEFIDLDEFEDVESGEDEFGWDEEDDSVDEDEFDRLDQMEESESDDDNDNNDM